MTLSKSQGSNGADSIVRVRECTLQATHAKLVSGEEAKCQSEVDVGTVEESEALMILLLKHLPGRAGESLTVKKRRMRSASLMPCSKRADKANIASSK